MARVFPGGRHRLNAHDRLPSAIAHLLSLLPLWGVLFAAGIVHHYRESSRHIAFQARQAALLHLVFLAAGVGGILLRLFLQLLDTAFPLWGLDQAVLWLDETKAVALYIVFALIAVFAATVCAMGHGIVYPVLGPRLWKALNRLPDDELYG